MVVLLLLVTLIFSADAKGLLIEGLMKIGLFQPDIPKVAAESNVPASNKTSLTQDVEFIDSKGNTISLFYQNGKVVFINFWATWCPPCIAEMPTIDQLHEKYKRSVTFHMPFGLRLCEQRAVKNREANST